MVLNLKDHLIPSPLPPVQFSIPQFLVSDLEVDTLIRTIKARNSFAVNGNGLTVAVLDTGLRVTHEDFRGKVPFELNLTSDNSGDSTDANDGNGHGTNVGGIIVADGIHKGIAPKANIIPIKVLSNNGGGSFEAVNQALNWVISNHEAYKISVVSVSLGDSQNYTSDLTFKDHDIQKAVSTLRNLRIPVVVAAGNEYFTFKSQGLSFPAILRETISVGAVFDANVGSRSYKSGASASSTAADRITPFSQRLHESVESRTRIDIFAPGAPITSSGIDSDRGESVQDGTSQATPVVSGVILLMQEYYLRTKGELPEIDFIADCLRNGAVSIHDGDDEADNVPHTNRRFLRIDVVNALDAVRRQLQIELLSTATAFVV